MKLAEIINRIKHFTNSEKEILEYILNNKEDVAKMSSSTLAEKTFTSPPTITRLSKKLGCAGFNELKYLINQDLTEVEQIDSDYENLMLLKNDIHSTLEFIDKTEFSELNQSLRKSRRIYTYGTSWGERNALEMFTRNFLAMNIHFVDIPSITEFQWIANEIGKNDLVIVISYSGENDEVLNVVREFKLRSIPVISITPMHENTLAQMSTISLYYAVTELRETKSTRSFEHNLFTTLHVLLDAVYRKFLDSKS